REGMGGVVLAERIAAGGQPHFAHHRVVVASLRRCASKPCPQDGRQGAAVRPAWHWPVPLAVARSDRYCSSAAARPNGGMPMNRWSAIALISLPWTVGFPCAGAANAGTTDCNIRPSSGEAAPVAAAAVAFSNTLSSAQRVQLDQPLSRAT